MREIISTITSKGQVTIPAEVRKCLHLKTGDKVSFILDDSGEIQLKAPRYPNVAAVVGAAGSLKTPLSWEEMRQIAGEDRLAEENEHSR